MKTIIVCCGSSMITSSVAVTKIQERLKQEGIDVKIIQCKFAEVMGNIDQYNPVLVVPTGTLKEEQTKGVPMSKEQVLLLG